MKGSFLLQQRKVESVVKGVYTKEELIAVIQDLDRKLGHVPTKKDLPDRMLSMCHREFGKWCYALEAAGVKVPSEATLARRAHHKAKWRKRHKEMSRMRTAAGKAEYAKRQRDKKDRIISDSDQQC